MLHAIVNILTNILADNINNGHIANIAIENIAKEIANNIANIFT